VTLHTREVATKRDALYISQRLRPADIAEARASGIDGEAQLRAFDPDRYLLPTVFKADGEPYIIAAAVPPDPYGFSVAWAVGTPLVDKYPRAFCRLMDKQVEDWLAIVPCIGNAVHDDNHVHISWLKWAGFTFEPPILIGRETFHPFFKRS
jgi:hypothetical protein